MLILSVIIFIAIYIFYMCSTGHKEYISCSIQATIIVLSIWSAITLKSKVIKVILFNWINFSFDSPIFFPMHSHYTSRHIYSIFIFIYFVFLLHFLLWSQNICCWKNCCRKWGESSFYVYTDKIISNSTC